MSRKVKQPLRFPVRLAIGMLLLLAGLALHVVPDAVTYYEARTGPIGVNSSGAVPAADFGVNHQGPLALFRHGRDPYFNINLWNLFNPEAGIPIHPSKLMNASIALTEDGDHPDGGSFGQFGYIASPVTLWLVSFLIVARMPFPVASAVIVAFSLAALCGMVTYFALKLSRTQ